MRTLYVIRHAEPALTGVLLGRTDPPLSAVGEAQCEGIEIDAAIFYSSPLRRTLESARRIAKSRTLVILPDLIEIALGSWDGRRWCEIETEQPALAAAKIADWTGVVPPGGEHWSAFTTRVDRAMERILAGVFPAAVIGHVAVNAWIAHRFVGSDPLRYTQPYADIKTYVF